MSSHMPTESKNGANQCVLTVEFGDCDPARIVHYPNFFRWFDEGTHHLFAAAGFPLPVLSKDRGLSIPVVSARADFVGPAVWGDQIIVNTRIARWGGKSFDIAHSISDAETGTVVAEGRETRVCVTNDPDAAKALCSVPVPEDIRAALGG